MRLSIVQTLGIRSFDSTIGIIGNRMDLPAGKQPALPAE